MRVSDADIRERRANLIQILQNDADISLAELSSVLEVSESTVRRDMNYLKERNILSTSIKNSNGQFTTNFVPEFDNDLMFNTKVEEKEAIAKEAASMLESGDVVYINSSSTALRVIKYITCGFVTVIT
ncbi:MAG: DeoR/GlpR transcriptional regulator, partial [Clostridiaceae bacterium]|nr:DeoR/GlpR transcriptional regulator [Clostridiaceae bacterium]